MKTVSLLPLLALATTAVTGQAHAVDVDVQVTADNAYAIYTGEGSSVTDHWATEFNATAGAIATPETYSFTMDEADVIYVVAWSDDATHQGLLAEFNIGGTVVTTASTHWEVMATGIDLDVGDTAPTMDDLTAQVQLADGGGGASSGWVTPELGHLNDGSALVNVPAMATNVQWAWYRSAATAAGDTAFLPGANHDEYLIFRMIFPMEGCCLEDECLNTSPEDCTDQGGLPLGDGLLCEDFEGECAHLEDTYGACCTEEECVELTREDCVAEDGTYLGDEVSCADDDVDCTDEEPPEVGACCVDGECIELDAAKCAEHDGVFAGLGVSCDDILGECDEPTSEDGACCTEETCEITDPLSCEHGGGVFQGVGTDCTSGEVDCTDGDGTADPVDTSTEIEEAKPAKGCSALDSPAAPLGVLGLFLTMGLVARRRELR